MAENTDNLSEAAALTLNPDERQFKLALPSLSVKGDMDMHRGATDRFTIPGAALMDMFSPDNLSQEMADYISQNPSGLPNLNWGFDGTTTQKISANVIAGGPPAGFAQGGFMRFRGAAGYERAEGTLSADVNGFVRQSADYIGDAVANHRAELTRASYDAIRDVADRTQRVEERLRGTDSRAHGVRFSDDIRQQAEHVDSAVDGVITAAHALNDTINRHRNTPLDYDTSSLPEGTPSGMKDALDAFHAQNNGLTLGQVLDGTQDRLTYDATRHSGYLELGAEFGTGHQRANQGSEFYGLAMGGISGAVYDVSGTDYDGLVPREGQLYVDLGAGFRHHKTIHRGDQPPATLSVGIEGTQRFSVCEANLDGLDAGCNGISNKGAQISGGVRFDF